VTRTEIATLGLSVLAALAALELGLRAAGISYPEFNRLDPRLGWAPRPGLEGRDGATGASVAINREGFRDRDHAPAKPAGGLRVAVLGDSFVEAREVALEDAFWKVMERRLRACLGGRRAPVEVLGFGVNGYGPAQELLVLEHRVWRYAPDAVVLALFTGNDVANASRRLDGHPDRPYYVLDNGALRLDSSGLETARFAAKRRWSELKHGLYNRLRTLQVARTAYKRTKLALRYRRMDQDAQLGHGLDPGVYRPPTGGARGGARGGAWGEAWEVTEAILEAMARAARQRGAGFWIATLTNPLQVHPDPGLRARLAAALGLEDLSYPERRIAAFGAREGIPVITLAEPLGALAEARGTPLHGSAGFAGGHWNAAGHRAAGERLGAVLCRAYGGD